MQGSELHALQQFFGTPANPVTMPELATLWVSCSDEEKAGFKRAIQGWDGKSEFVS